MSTVLIPIPTTAFDPTETAIPWKILHDLGHTIVFATPDGSQGQADRRMLTGQGLGPLAPILVADTNAQKAYRDMIKRPAFRQPISYPMIKATEFDALLLPGGHAPGMKVYLESNLVQKCAGEFFQQNKPVGAICHGVLVAARSQTQIGKSNLFGKKTTALTRLLELSAWSLTCIWRGNYYRTYPKTVEDEVTEALAKPSDFVRGPLALSRDSSQNLKAGFTLLDGNYLSARWPGDAHCFATEFAGLLNH